MKEFLTRELKKSLAEFTAKKFTETYQAGLTDVKSQTPMKFKFYPDHVEVSYQELFMLIPKTKKFTIRKEDIVELELQVEGVNNTGNVVAGAIAGNMLAGGLGALAMAGANARKTKQDFLHLVIKYKGENRPLVLTTSKHTQEIYRLLKEMR